MSTCAVLECREAKTYLKYKLHPLPKIKELANIWLQRAGSRRKNIEQYLCSRHFSETQYKNCDVAEKLKLCALPSLFLPEEYPVPRAMLCLQKSNLEITSESKSEKLKSGLQDGDKTPDRNDEYIPLSPTNDLYDSEPIETSPKDESQFIEHTELKTPNTPNINISYVKKGTRHLNSFDIDTPVKILNTTKLSDYTNASSLDQYLDLKSIKSNISTFVNAVQANNIFLKNLSKMTDLSKNGPELQPEFVFVPGEGNVPVYVVSLNIPYVGVVNYAITLAYDQLKGIIPFATNYIPAFRPNYNKSQNYQYVPTSEIKSHEPPIFQPVEILTNLPQTTSSSCEDSTFIVLPHQKKYDNLLSTSSKKVKPPQNKKTKLLSKTSLDLLKKIQGNNLKRRKDNQVLEIYLNKSRKNRHARTSKHVNEDILYVKKVTNNACKLRNTKLTGTNEKKNPTERKNPLKEKRNKNVQEADMEEVNKEGNDLVVNTDNKGTGDFLVVENINKKRKERSSGNIETDEKNVSCEKSVNKSIFHSKYKISKMEGNLEGSNVLVKTKTVVLKEPPNFSSESQDLENIVEDGEIVTKVNNNVNLENKGITMHDVT